MINVNFNLRNPKNKDVVQGIRMLFSINKERVKLNTMLHVTPTQWSVSDKRVNSKHQDYKKMNALLKEQKDFVEKYLNDLLFTQSRFYRDDLQKAFNLRFKVGVIEEEPESGEIHDFISFIDFHISTKGDNARGTIASLLQTRKHIIVSNGLITPMEMKMYEGTNLKDFKPKKKIFWSQLNKRNVLFVEAFKKYLLERTYQTKESDEKITIGYSKNHIAKSIKNLKQFLNAASIYGYITDLSYKSLNSEWEESDKIYTDWDEIEGIKAIEFNTDLVNEKTLSEIRDLYVFNCYCGLRFSDLKKLASHRFIERKEVNKQGDPIVKVYLKLNRTTKTGQPLLYPLLPSAEAILRKYEFQLPRMADQTFNEGIKTVCLRSGMTRLETIRITRGGDTLENDIPRWKLVASHTARRSFATNFDADGVPLKEIMAITGHTTERALRTYIKKPEETEFIGFQSAGINR